MNDLTTTIAPAADAAPPEGRPPRKRRDWRGIAALVMSALALIVAIGAASTAGHAGPPGPQGTQGPGPQGPAGPQGDAGTAAGAASGTSTGGSTSTAGLATAISDSGVYVVGQDIAPGTWHTSGTGTGDTAYYAELSSPDGSSVDNIIDNNNVAGPATVHLGGNVKAFEINGGATWTRTGP